MNVSELEEAFAALVEDLANGTCTPTYVVGFGMETADVDQTTRGPAHDNFATVALKGPEQGIHIFGSWSTVAGMNQPDKTRRTFGHRVFTPPDPDDLLKLHSPMIKTKPNRAVLVSINDQNTPEVFIPYRSSDLPDTP